jgi:RHS repeat-associated protein
LRFPGQYYLPETGLYYNYFRDYDPVTWRYLESDPIGIWGGYSTYAYVLDNPLMLVDLRGRSPAAAIGALTTGIMIRRRGRYLEIGLAGASYSTYSYANSNPISNRAGPTL